MTLNEIRGQFPHLKNNEVYFNHASIGPMPEQVKNSIINYAEERNYKAIKNYENFLIIEDQTKTKLGLILGTDKRRIAWSYNIADSFSFLLNGLKWNDGDHIILNDIEFPSNVYPFLNLQQKGVVVEIIKTRNGRISIEDVESAIRPETKLLSISFVQFLTGYKTDLKKLGEVCKKHKIIYCVDGIQGIGNSEIKAEEWGIDFLAGSAQKWLMSLQGCGFFYMSDKLMKEFNQPAVGWYSVKSDWNLLDYNTELKDTAERFDTGTRNAIGITALNSVLDLFLSYGLNNVYENVLRNTKYLMDSLYKTGIKPLMTGVEENNLSAIVTYKCDNPEEVKSNLAKKKISVEVRERHVRISPHFYNIQEEIDLLIKELAKLSS